MEDSERYKTGERAIASLVAVLVPALVVSVLMVMTAVSSRPREKIVVDIATASPDVDPLVPDEDKQDPVDAPDDPAEPDVQITVDAPTVAPVAEVSALAPVETAAEPVAQKPAPAEAVQRITCPVRMPGMASRTAAMRRRFTDGTAGCGDVATESAVMKALRWLKKTQKPNGSWDGNPIANTGLAILAYLAHGEVPSGSREFGPAVQRALDSLLAAQTGDGMSRDAAPGLWGQTPGQGGAGLHARVASGLRRREAVRHAAGGQSPVLLLLCRAVQVPGGHATRWRHASAPSS